MPRPAITLAILVALAIAVWLDRRHQRPVSPAHGSGTGTAMQKSIEPTRSERPPEGPHGSHEHRARPRSLRDVATLGSGAFVAARLARVSSPALRSRDTGGALAAVDAAMPAVLPQLHACYDRVRADLASPEVAAEVDLTLTGDSDIGTMVDADVLLALGPRLPDAFVDCLRAELQQLDLPAMAVGEHVLLRYPFAFDPDHASNGSGSPVD